MCLRFNKSTSIAKATDDEVKRNAEIDKVIRRDKKAQAKNVKILLLGMEAILCTRPSQLTASRRGGIGQVDHLEADASHLHRRLLGARTERGAPGHLCQSNRGIQNHRGGNAGPESELLQ
jgi:hypothetical protein